MADNKGEYSLAEMAVAMKLVNERPMVPHSLDLIGATVMQGKPSCASKIEIRWDQWAECTITCDHGKWKATSDFLNLTEAFLRAVRLFQGSDHPRRCGRLYVDRTPLGDGTIEPLEIDCTLFEGHEGECGGD